MEIDGSQGEGGGQIIRTALSLAALTHTDVKLVNIRAGRKKPGLMPQHLTAIKALAKTCNANISGAKLHSTSIFFSPGKIENSNIIANIGTAGSVTLLAQQLLPVAIASNLRLRAFGGTDVSFAPTACYMQRVTLHYLKKMKANLSLKTLSRGYYPKGNGCIALSSEPSFPLKPLNCTGSGTLNSITCHSHCAGMPAKVAKDTALIAKHSLKEKLGSFEWIQFIEASPERKQTFGAGLDLFAKYTNSVIGSNSVSSFQIKPETLASAATQNLLNEINRMAALDSHCIDQIIPFMALADGKSTVTAKLTKHAKTNISITEKFLGVKFKITQENQISKISVKGRGFTI